MSFIITTDVFCDKCGDWTEGAVGKSVSRREAWDIAKSRGWTRVNRKHFCPVCSGTHYKSDGSYYRKEKRSR